MTYLGDWQAAKKAFEQATGKKKPSESFLGMFRKSSGLETTTKGLDEALKKPTADVLDKALTAFEKARLEYVKLLQKADAGDKTVDYSKEIQKLDATLKAILDDYTKKRMVALETAPRALSEILGKDFTGMISAPLAAKPSVKWFATTKALGLSGADGKTPVSGAAQQISLFIANIKKYQAACAAAKNAGKQMVGPKEAGKLARQLFAPIADAVMPMAEGASYNFRMWADAQEKVLGGGAKLKDYLEKGPFAAQLKKLGADLDDERVRLANIEATLERM